MERGCTREEPGKPADKVKTSECSALREVDVGITEYVNRHVGFSGIIKQRFSDFHVNEIDTDGNVVTLTTTVPPEPPAEPAFETEEAEKYLKNFFSEETVEKLKQSASEEGSDKVEFEVTDMSKDDRRKLHHAVKAVGSKDLVSNTQEKDGKKFIIISKLKRGAKPDIRNPRWPADRKGDFVHFVVYKENMDTMETVNLIAAKLRLQSNMIGYAGTKDRRGKTSQLMSVRRVEPTSLVNVGNSIRGVVLGNYTFKEKCLKLGDLQGNRFRVVLRNVTGSDEQIDEALMSLKEKGFLNYFGLQRFGSSAAVPTYDIGRVLLKGDWKLAVELILKPRDDQNWKLKEARRIWWETRDASRALKVLRNGDKLLEGKLLLGLSQRSKNNYVDALEKVPRNTRLLYLHSYQSLVWNKVVSRRVQQFGLEPLEGDLVLVADKGQEQLPVVEKERRTLEDEDGEDDCSSRKLQVRVLTAQDLGTVSIDQVVLPLPGHDVTYPQNVIKEWYEELLALDGLSSAQLKQNKVRKYSVGGAYRKMIVRPSNVSWKTMRYSDPQKTLVLSDLEVLKGEQAPTVEPDGSYKALLADFQLPSASYATMALREILKMDTSSQHQASLNHYHCSEESSEGKKDLAGPCRPEGETRKRTKPADGEEKPVEEKKAKLTE